MAAAGSFVHELRRAAFANLGLALVIMSLVLAVAVPARADEPQRRSFTTEGDCTESVLGVMVDADKAQDLVPDGFVVRQVGGKSLVTAFAEDCVMSVNGHEEFATTLSGTAVGLSRPAGSYDFTWNSDAGQYFSAYHRLGIGNLIPHSDYGETQLAPAVVRSDAHIPGDFEFSFHSGEATSPDDPLLDNALESVHWGFGPFGAVRGKYPHDLRGASGGIGVLQAEPGSALAELIGADPVQAAGVLLRFHFRGTVELADV